MSKTTLDTLDQQAVKDAIADLASIVYNDKYVTHDV
jgi:hypothetical protein